MTVLLTVVILRVRPTSTLGSDRGVKNQMRNEMEFWQPA